MILHLPFYNKRDSIGTEEKVEKYYQTGKWLAIIIRSDFTTFKPIILTRSFLTMAS